MDDKDNIEIDQIELMKQMKEEALKQENYIHVDLIITDDIKKQFTGVQINKGNSILYGKTLLCVKGILNTLINKADQLHYYILQHIVLHQKTL